MTDLFQTSGKSPTSDFICENHCPVFLLRPVSLAALTWIEESLPPDRITFGNAVAVDHRCIWSILLGLQEDGLTAVPR
jgi:hypothetical protein